MFKISILPERKVQFLYKVLNSVEENNHSVF